ncbi:MAG: hypothetical protein ACE5D7_01945 [Fidelibacterota bacterium]
MNTIQKVIRKSTILFAIVPVFMFGWSDQGEIVRFGEDLTIEENTSVERVVVIGGSVSVYGEVEEEVVAIGGSIYLGPNAMVGSDVVSIGGNVEKHTSAIIKGKRVELGAFQLHHISHLLSPGNLFGFWWFGKIMVGLGILCVGLLIVILFPITVQSVADTITRSPFISSFAGIAGAVLFVPTMILIAISLIGIPLLPLMAIAFAGSMLVGYVAMSFLLGSKAATGFGKEDISPVGAAITGLLILWMISFIPILGSVIKIIVSIIGFGGVIMTLINKRQNSLKST